MSFFGRLMVDRVQNCSVYLEKKKIAWKKMLVVVVMAAVVID